MPFQNVIHGTVASTDALPTDMNQPLGYQTPATMYLPPDQQTSPPYPLGIHEIPAHFNSAGLLMVHRSDNSGVHNPPLIVGHHTLSPPVPQFMPHPDDVSTMSGFGSLDLLLRDNARAQPSQQVSAMTSGTTRISARSVKAERKKAKETKKHPCPTCHRRYKTESGLR